MAKMLKNKISFFFTILFLLYGPQNLFAQAQENPASLDQTKLDKKTESNYQLTVDKIDPSRFNNVAVIQGLNKIIAKTSLLEIKIGDTIKFGKLNITVHKCWQSPLEQKPESKILLEIYDTASSSEDDQSTRKRIFYGWMLSSSPSISGIEHPIYDITAIGCKNR
jgi:hypothetical protein